MQSFSQTDIFITSLKRPAKSFEDTLRYHKIGLGAPHDTSGGFDS